VRALNRSPKMAAIVHTGRIAVIITDWDQRVESIRRSLIQQLLKSAFPSKDTPAIRTALSYLRESQHEDGYWDMDRPALTKESLSLRAACTSYACLIMPRAAKQEKATMQKGLEWIERVLETLLTVDDILNLAYTAYHLTRIYQAVEHDEKYLNMADQLLKYIVSFQNDDQGWSSSSLAKMSEPEATAAVMRALWAFHPIEYQTQIDQARDFLSGYTDWIDTLKIASVCVMLLEIHEARNSSLVLDLINRIKNSQTNKGSFGRRNEPNVLTTSIALRALNHHGETLDLKIMQEGMRFLMDPSNMRGGGWPFDTSRHVPDPWTTTDVIHTLMHLDRVIPAGMAITALIALEKEIKRETESMSDEMQFLRQKIDRLTEIQQMYESRWNSIYKIENAIRKESQARESKLNEKIEKLQKQVTELTEDSAAKEEVEKERDRYMMQNQRMQRKIEVLIGLLAASIALLIPLILSLLQAWIGK